MKEKKAQARKFVPRIISLTTHRSSLNMPVFRGLHHECLEAILRKS